MGDSFLLLSVVVTALLVGTHAHAQDKTSERDIFQRGMITVRFLRDKREGSWASTSAIRCSATSSSRAEASKCAPS